MDAQDLVREPSVGAQFLCLTIFPSYIFEDMKLFLFVVALSIASKAHAQTCAVEDKGKRDCGFAGIDSNSCQAKGCCWAPAEQNSGKIITYQRFSIDNFLIFSPLITPPATPWCFYKDGSNNEGYKLTSMAKTDSGFAGKLTKIGAGSSVYGQDLTNLALTVSFVSSVGHFTQHIF